MAKNAVFKTASEAFSGEIVLRMPDFDERYSYLEEFGGELSAEGPPDIRKRIATLRKIVKLSEAHYLKVELTKKADGSKISSFGEMSEDEDAHPILIEVGTFLLNGNKLGNS